MPSLVPSSDTSQPLFSHPFFPTQGLKAAIRSSTLKSQSRPMMSLKSIRALELVRALQGNTFRAAATRGKELGTESLTLPCFPVVRNKGPPSSSSGSLKKREAGTQASFLVSLKRTSGMSNDRFNKQRKPTESQGAKVQRKKNRIWEAARAWE